MKRGKKPLTRFELEGALDDAVRGASGLLTLIVAALENDCGTGISALGEKDRSNVALLCQEVEHRLSSTQDALDAMDAAGEVAPL